MAFCSQEPHRLGGDRKPADQPTTARQLQRRGERASAPATATDTEIGRQAPEGGERHHHDQQQWLCPLTLPSHSSASNDIGLFPEGLQALKQVAKEVGWALRGASANRAGGGDSTPDRAGICNAGLMPTGPEDRDRKST
jgi:hypothetical protein